MFWPKLKRDFVKDTDLPLFRYLSPQDHPCHPTWERPKCNVLAFKKREGDFGKWLGSYSQIWQINAFAISAGQYSSKEERDSMLVLK